MSNDLIIQGWVKFDDDNKPIWSTFQIEEPDNVEDWHQAWVTE